MNDFSFAYYRISMAFLMLYILLFLRRKSAPLWALACLLLSTGVDYLDFYVFDSWYSRILCTLVNIVLVQGTAFLCSNWRDMRALFVGMSGATFVLCGSTVGILCYVTTEQLLLSLLMCTLAHMLLLWLLKTDIIPALRRCLEQQEDYWGQMCLLPALYYMTLYALYVWPGNIYENPLVGVGGILVVLTMGLGYTLMGQLVLWQKEANEQQRSRDALEHSARLLRREAEQLRTSERKTAILRHDMRHQVQILMAYLDAGQTDRLREALVQVSDEISSAAAAKIYCENIAVNGALVHCAELARSKEVELLCAVDVPKSVCVNEFELGTVISNLTENAILAAAEVPAPQQRFVEVTFRRAKSQYLLEVKNNYTGKCVLSPETGLPVSEKGAGHGYGLRSVIAFAQRYHALFDCDVKPECFCVRLLLEL